MTKDDGWRIPDWLWERIEPLLPERGIHACSVSEVSDTPTRTPSAPIWLGYAELEAFGEDKNAREIRTFCGCELQRRLRALRG